MPLLRLLLVPFLRHVSGKLDLLGQGQLPLQIPTVGIENVNPFVMHRPTVQRMHIDPRAKIAITPQSFFRGSLTSESSGNGKT